MELNRWLQLEKTVLNISHIVRIEFNMPEGYADQEVNGATVFTVDGRSKVIDDENDAQLLFDWFNSRIVCDNFLSGVAREKQEVE